MIWSKQKSQLLTDRNIINALNHKQATLYEARTYESKQNILNAISFHFADLQFSSGDLNQDHRNLVELPIDGSELGRLQWAPASSS